MNKTNRSPIGDPYKNAPQMEKSDLEKEYEQALGNKELLRSYSENTLTKILIKLIEQRRVVLLDMLTQAPMDKVQYIQGQINQLDGILYIVSIK